MTGRVADRAYQVVGDKKDVISFLVAHSEHAFFFKTKTGALPVDDVRIAVDHRYELFSTHLLKVKRVRLLKKGGTYKELVCQVDSIHALSNGTYRYLVRPLQLVAPLVGRETARYKADKTKYQILRIMFADIDEKPGEISSSKFFKQVSEKLKEELSRFSFVRVFPVGMLSAPSEVSFCMLTGGFFYLKDLNNYNSFFVKNEAFFSQFPDLRNHLINRVKTLKLRYSSLLVRPIDYLTLAGHQFSIAFLVLAKEQGEITTDDILMVDQNVHTFLNTLTKRVRTTAKVRGSVENISHLGIRILLPLKAEPILESKKTLSITLRVVGYADIAIAGEIAYVEKSSKGLYVGLNFKHSHLGIRLERMLFDLIKSHDLEEI